MIDDELQDQAALYVLNMLPPTEADAFEARLNQDAELKAIVAELEEGAAAVSRTAPLIAPPADLKDRIIADIRHEVRIVPVTFASRMAWVPWALAAGLAIATTMFWQDSHSQRGLVAQKDRTLSEKESALADLRSRDALASMEIATLSSKVQAYEKVLAVIVFNPKDQRGLVKLDRFPKASTGKDYQLWVIPRGGKPVSAGLVPVSDTGLAQVSFTPATRVEQAIDAFAISVEPKGGSVQPRGEVVLVGR